MKRPRVTWALILTANLLGWGMLSFYQTGDAAPKSGQLPFANSVEQRNQIIRELQEVRELLKEQNALLRAANQKNAQPIRQR